MTNFDWAALLSDTLGTAATMGTVFYAAAGKLRPMARGFCRSA